MAWKAESFEQPALGAVADTEDDDDVVGLANGVGGSEQGVDGGIEKLLADGGQGDESHSPISCG